MGFMSLITLASSHNPHSGPHCGRHCFSPFITHTAGSGPMCLSHMCATAGFKDLPGPGLRSLLVNCLLCDVRDYNNQLGDYCEMSCVRSAFVTSLKHATCVLPDQRCRFLVIRSTAKVHALHKSSLAYNSRRLYSREACNTS